MAQLNLLTAYRHFPVALLVSIFLAIAACGGPARAQADDHETRVLAKNVLNSWERATVWSAGARITSWNAPGDSDTSSLLIEFVFGLPDRFVDMGKLTEGLVSGLNLEIGESLPTGPLPGVYQKAFMANEPGKPVHQVNIIALRELGQQRILMLAALPENYAKLGGRDFLLAQFVNNKPLSDVARDVDAAEALLASVDNDAPMTTSKSSESLSHGEFAMMVETVELLSGARLTVAEIETLRSSVIAEWNEKPDASQFETMRAFLAKVRAADADKQLEVAALVYASAYLKEKSEGEFSVLMRKILNLNPVRAEAKEEILTARAIEARLRSLEIVLQLQGNSPDMTKRERDRAEKILVQGFAKMTDKSRTALVQAELRGLRLTGWLTGLSSAQQQKQLNLASISSNTSALMLTEQLEQNAITRSSLPAGLEQMILFPSLLIDLQSARP